MQTKQFDFDGIMPDNGNYFGMPLSPDEAALVLVSAPWDVTVATREGSSYAPDAIIEASRFIGLSDPANGDSWRKGIATAPIDYTIQDASHRLRSDALRIIKLLDEMGLSFIENIISDRRLKRINEMSAQINENIYNQTKQWLAKGKIVGLVGGDQSTIYGAVKAVGEKYGRIGVLHIDSQCDMDEESRGFDYSNSSVMRNVMQDVAQIECYMGVGMRDFTPAVWRKVQEDPRMNVCTAEDVSRREFEGATWRSVCDEIVAKLPDNVYVSLDIDALTLECSPHTGVRVPGGLPFQRVVYLLERLVESGRRIVGFDLTEVVPDLNDKSDAAIAARLLFKMCNVALKHHHAVEII